MRPRGEHRELRLGGRTRTEYGVADLYAAHAVIDFVDDTGGVTTDTCREAHGHVVAQQPLPDLPLQPVDPRRADGDTDPARARVRLLDLDKAQDLRAPVLR